MKTKWLFVSLWMAIGTAAIAQNEPQFKVSVADTVGMEGYFEVRFVLENVAGQKFSPPDFEGFRIVGGPSQSSNFSMINGKTTQSLTYIYYVEPLETGIFVLGEASIQTDKGELRTAPKEIVVLEHYVNKEVPATTRRRPGLFPDEEKADTAKPVKPRKIYKL